VFAAVVIAANYIVTILS